MVYSERADINSGGAPHSFHRYMSEYDKERFNVSKHDSDLLGDDSRNPKYRKTTNIKWGIRCRRFQTGLQSQKNLSLETETDSTICERY